MSFNFPNAPTVGQLYPSPAMAGAPVWAWDGAAWKTVGGQGLGGIYISDTAPAGAPVGSLWWESDTGMLYIYYNDGDSSQWVAAVPVSDATTYAVRFDQAQSLTQDSGVTIGQRTQARMNIAAAPFDAEAYNGLQLNGGMEVNQDLGLNNYVNTPGKYIVDGWSQTWAGSAVLSSAQSTWNLYGCPNIIGCTVQTAQAAMGAGDVYYIGHAIEGYRIARLGWGTSAAQPLTIGFWTDHFRGGLYSVCLRNSDGSRSCVATYNQVGSALQYNVVTFPGCTDGTWHIDNTAGISLAFALACGSTYTAPQVGVWQTQNYVAAPGQVNGVQTTSDVFRLTGVIVLPGLEAPPSIRSSQIMRPYPEEIIRCKRYYQKIFNPPGSAMGNGNNFLYYWSFPLPVSLRAAPPNVSISGNMTFTTPTNNYVGFSISSNNCTADTWLVSLNATGPVPAGFVQIIPNTSSAAIVDARF